MTPLKELQTQRSGNKACKKYGDRLTKNLSCRWPVLKWPVTRSEDYLHRVEDFLAGYKPGKTSLNCYEQKQVLGLLFKNIKIARRDIFSFDFFCPLQFSFYGTGEKLKMPEKSKTYGKFAPRVYIRTFGCQMNVHDSERISEILSGMGLGPAGDDKDADIILFNTCTVRDHAHHKAISEIGRAIFKKKRKKDLIVGVCGCVAQEEKENLFRIYPELDIVFGPDQITRLPELLNEVIPLPASCFMPRCAEAGGRKQEARKTIATELIDDPDEYKWLFHDSQTPAIDQSISKFVTIMKGCNNKCSFCIVPFVRGSEVSKPSDDIVSEIKGLVAKGVKEVTLLGQNVNSYNGAYRPERSEGSGEHNLTEQDPSGLSPSMTNTVSPFVLLLQKISSETDILRIRYTSPHPKDLCDDLINEHAANPKLCSHMHLPLQAGSDRVLRMMKRSYNKKQFIERSLKLRERAVGIDITTDIIVGFPGETHEDFLKTLEVVKEVSFDGMFAFKYSPRHGTVAAEIEDDVPQKEKEGRLARLLELNADIWKQKTARLVGTTQQVLVEGASKKSTYAPFDPAQGTLTHSSTYALQMSGRTFGSKIVNFAGNLEQVGSIVPVTIVSAGPNSLKGELRV